MTPAFDDAFICDSVPAEVMDQLWEAGWRHFGNLFFRYSTQMSEHGTAQTITPLRIDVARFCPSKSQRRVLRKNEGLRWEIVPAQIDDSLRAMFQRHKQRFTHNVPDALETFIGSDPASGPCACHMLRVFAGDWLIAASFFDVGRAAASSVYGIFEPECARRSLGIFTMLLEIQHAHSVGLRWLYPGYATHEASVYDYKKQFNGTEILDWASGAWHAYRKVSRDSLPNGPDEGRGGELR